MPKTKKRKKETNLFKEKRDGWRHVHEEDKRPIHLSVPTNTNTCSNSYRRVDMSDLIIIITNTINGETQRTKQRRTSLFLYTYSSDK